MKKFWIIVFFLSFIFGVVHSLFAEEITRADSLLKAKKYFSFAVQHKNAGNIEDALKNYKSSIAYNDSVYQVHYSFADFLLSLGRIPEARGEYLTSFSLNPHHYNSAAMLAKLYHESAQYDSALIMYEAMYRLEPEHKGLLASIAGMREYLGKKSEALSAYEELIENGDDSFDNIMHAGVLALSIGDLKKALFFSSRALIKNANNKCALRTASEAAFGLDDMATASNYLHRLAEVDSTDITVLIKLENVSRAQGDLPTLTWALGQHYLLSPQTIPVIWELSEILFRTGDYEKGVMYVRRGIELSPQDGQLHILMGDYYRHNGNKDKALTEYNAALEDERWRSNAQQLIWALKKPETDEEKAEREFFNRGKKSPE